MFLSIFVACVWFITPYASLYILFTQSYARFKYPGAFTRAGLGEEEIKKQGYAWMVVGSSMIIIWSLTPLFIR